jgi:hypothetical protein
MDNALVGYYKVRENTPWSEVTELPVSYGATQVWQLTAPMLPTKLFWRDWGYVGILWR